MRPGTSQARGYRDPVSGSAAPPAADRDAASVAAHASQLGLALAESAQKLASARRELAMLRRENAELRASAERGNVT